MKFNLKIISILVNVLKINSTWDLVALQVCLSDVGGEVKSDNDERVEFLVGYEVYYENGNSVNKSVKDEVTEKIDGSVD